MEELPIGIDIRGRLKDEAEDIHEIKFTLADDNGNAVADAMMAV